MVHYSFFHTCCRVHPEKLEEKDLALDSDEDETAVVSQTEAHQNNGEDASVSTAANEIEEEITIEDYDDELT